ncbi:MAG TPA: Dyp-type peroxidase, partial [Polymorphobacter sp.]|nr:Dyp-type peroxidase [Polymorphobacter sp.]
IIATMFRLTRYYGANIAGGNLAEDALTLLLATRGLLGDWDAASVKPLDRQRFARELAWFAQPIPGKPGSVAPQVPVAREKVQRGILTGFDTDTATISHGAMLFIKVSDPGLAAASLASLAASIATESLNVASDGIYRNLALTYAGLQNLGLKADLLKQFPEALREGAAARAGQVGDVRTFHPSHWTPLPRNWPAATAETASLSLVDAVIQLRVVSDSKVSDIYNAAHPLHAAIAAVAALPGLKLLSVETLAPAADQPRGFNSFGLRDGISQPTITERKADAWSDTVAAGDLLLGHLNAAQDIPIAGTGAADADLANGSYLAIRRMPMNPDNFDKLIEKAKALTGLDKDVIKGKIVGRAADGSALVPATGGNDFVYVNDRDGALCPRQSHARRVNPRENAHGRPPRIARRGMSFTAHDGQGSMFMAYCANLGEQYEVVLRWLNGGNSTRIGSFLGDPLCGVPDKVRTRTYRFTHQGRVYRLQLPSEADAAVKLSWSLYLFAPSIDMIKALPKLVERPDYPKLDEGLLKLARKRIADLRSRNAREAEWRNILDEPGAQVSGLQAAVWQVIREEHGGLLRAHDSTPGIEVIDTLIDGQPGTQMYPDPIEVPPAPARDLWLVADHDKICTVLHDDGQKFSVKGAGERITESIKKFHLGLDAHTAEYKLESARCNAGLASVSATDAYDHAFARTSWLIDRIVAGRPAPVSIDLMKHLLEPAMALMAPDWFGIPDAGFGAVPGGEGHICMGSSDWRPVADRMPAFPGDFWNSSRYAFNPFISTETQRLSKEHGEAILAATEKYITNKGRRALEGTVVHSLLHRLNDAEPPAPSTDSDGYDGGVIQYPTDNDLARVLVGAMLGWIATTLGNAARLFDPLITSGNFQRLQDVWNDPQTP